MRETRKIALIGGATLAVLASVGFVTGVGSGIPAFAREEARGAEVEVDAQWRSFARDLASASGCNVTYEGPLRSTGRGSEFVTREGADFGSIGMLRIGASVGPAVLVMPDGWLKSKDGGRAYGHAGLGEARRFAQGIVSAAAFPGAPKEGNGLSFAELLGEGAVLVPVCFAESATLDSNWAESPARNFPVRWEQAVASSPRSAGPYPASHPGVRAITAWLNLSPDCAAVVMVGPESARVRPAKGFPAGTLGAFCEEVMGLHVSATGGDDAVVAVGETLRGCGELLFADVEWTRLGATNWSLDVTVRREGAHDSVAEPILVTARPADGQVALTAAAASVVSDGKVALELLPLRRHGLLLDAVPTGESQRLRLFFSGGAGEASGRRGQAAPSGARQASSPTVELRATSPKVKAAVIRSKSPV